ncbi:MAG: class A beta-lactamase-related serine hydrolase [Chloroflexota bacterium]|nr:class A beta-lactamase-related serine hydrolase [Chloroflexota bacterium]
MDLAKLDSDVAKAGGSLGVLAMSVPDGRTLSSLHEDESFPLASAAKLAIGWAAADAVRGGKVRWHTLVRGLELDPNDEGGRELYPHIFGQTELELREVVEVMIGALDHYYAMAVARQLGGWDAVQRRISDAYPGVRVHMNPYDPEQNSGQLTDVVRLARDVAAGYRKEPRLWRPVVAGLVRQQYKADDIPPHHVLNVQGGLGDAVIDTGLLGDIASPNLLAYAVAVKRIGRPEELVAAYNRLEDVIRDLYDDHIDVPA